MPFQLPQCVMHVFKLFLHFISPVTLFLRITCYGEPVGKPRLKTGRGFIVDQPTTGRSVRKAMSWVSKYRRPINYETATCFEIVKIALQRRQLDIEPRLLLHDFTQLF